MNNDRIHTILDEIDRELQFTPEPSHLYHYTTLAGLVGIASSRKLFLSGMLAADDQSENTLWPKCCYRDTTLSWELASFHEIRY
jgi:hypothetical protein